MAENSNNWYGDEDGNANNWKGRENEEDDDWGSYGYNEKDWGTTAGGAWNDQVGS